MMVDFVTSGIGNPCAVSPNIHILKMDYTARVHILDTTHTPAYILSSLNEVV
jgi:hypothetical protein